ncbi:MAG: hypothetical protein ABIZ80_10875, partial [Bryobacteraceae bacterium]
VADKEWEGWRVKPYGNAIYDSEGKLFKMWYDSGPTLEYFPGNSNYSSYAISQDGVAWEKPPVGAIESIKPGLQHNVVMGAQVPCVTKDLTKQTLRGRYKSICLIRDPVRTKVHEYHTMVSPDGLRGTKFSSQPVAPEADVITGYFDEERKLWVAFPKIHAVVGNHRRRCFHLITSPDFVHWSSPRLVFSPDLHDDASSLSRIEKVRPMLNDPDQPSEIRTEFYGVGAYVAESCTVAFPWVFTISGKAKYGNQEGPIEIQLAASRDLLHWERHFRKPVIAMSAPGAWDSGLFYTQARAIRVGDEIWVYYGGSNYTHGFPTRRHALGMKGRAITAAIGLAKWKLDRFVSADAPAEGGQLTTIPLLHDGERLELNANVKTGGEIRVEILDPGGKRLGKPSDPVKRDSLRSTAVWGGEPHAVAKFRAKPVSLRFLMKNAELYSFAFRRG